MTRSGWWRGPLTIDGGSGTGKSTLAAALAWPIIPVLEVGSVYRTVAQHVRPTDLPNFSADVLLRVIQLDSGETDSGLAADPDYLMDVTQEARVRSVVNHFQHDWVSKHEQSIVVGRIGGLLFPHATLKLFLTVSPAARRARMGSAHHLLDDAAMRDSHDSNRSVEPMRSADGAIIIDTSALSKIEIVARVDKILRPES